MLIYNAVIHPMDAPVLSNGFLEWAGGTIVQVGPMSSCPRPVGGGSGRQWQPSAPRLYRRPLSFGDAGRRTALR